MLLGIVVGAAVLAVLVAACAQSQAPSGAGGGNEVTTPSGLKYEDTKVGTGPEAKAGQTAVVHYTGWLTDGKKFDSSKDRGQPFTFPLGGFGQVEALGWVLWRRSSDCEVPRDDAGKTVLLQQGFGVLFEAISLEARLAIAKLIQDKGEK